MRKAGKPNSFYKGMKVDMDPSAQPKDSYRYAKNIRLNSFAGKNISIQPYDSDKLVFSLVTMNSTSDTFPAFSNINTWSQFVSGATSQNTDVLWESFFAWEPSTNGGMVSSGGMDLVNFFLTGDAAAYMNWGAAGPYGISVEQLQNETGFSEYQSMQDLQIVFDLMSQNGVGEESQLFDNFIYPSQNSMVSFYNYFIEQNPVIPLGYIISNESDAISLSFDVTLTMSSGQTHEINVPVPDDYTAASITNNDILIPALIASAITATDLSINSNISMVGDTNTAGGIQFLFNCAGADYVTNIEIVANGQLQIVPSISLSENSYPQAVADLWYNNAVAYYANLGYDFNAPELEGFAGMMLNIGYFMGWNYAAYLEYSGVTQPEINDEYQPIIITNQNLINVNASLIDSVIGDSSDADADGNDATMQILGHYSFSDYLVLLGTWMDANESESGQDFIIKTSQKKDGSLTNINNITSGEIFELYFIGNLGFNRKEKLKVVGIEESRSIRRLYFTDTKIPLKTINVGAPSSTYTPYVDNPSFFDLFVDSKTSIPRITGFEDGGNLDSIAHSYCFRYKTNDGRFSRMSPSTNPASLPVTLKSTEAAFTRGGNADENTGKTIKGIIENVDTRFPYLQLIHMPYVNGAPANGKVINTYAINQGDNDVDIHWSHTGSEEIIEEIIVEQFGSEFVNWNTCGAMEIKDNRLFVGNLKGAITDIETDFSVASYNSKNNHHSYEGGNPHLYHDLLYSMGGLDFGGNDTNPDVAVPESHDNGRFCKPNDVDLYRYIKGPGTPGDDNAAFYDYNSERGITYFDEDGNFVNHDSKRGVLGSESKYFNQAMDNGEKEGVRVTFRILGAIDTPAKPIQLDKDNKLITSGDYEGARAPFYKLNIDDGEGGHYASYANPVYNSNFVGYRRGEIYRFGIQFFDKKGNPMFVKRIGDVRMPEHSTEYYKQTYASGTSSIVKSRPTWPYYFQTSRSNLDHGFLAYPNKNWLNDSTDYEKPYSSKQWYLRNPEQGQYGCVLYPYFEVKLSSETCKKISGYSIVRVERDDINRSIVTSGVLQRAVRYQDNDGTAWNYQEENEGTFKWFGANAVEMDGRYGNDPMSIFTLVQQSYRSNRHGNHRTNFNSNYSTSTPYLSVADLKDGSNLSYASGPGITDQPIGGDAHWHFSNVYTMDSPDAIINDEFNLNFGAGDRIKITEQRYCVKDAVKNVNGDDGWPFQTFFNHYLADGQYNDWVQGGWPSTENTDYYLEGRALSLFACFIDPALLGGGTAYYGGASIDYGGWSHRLSPQRSYSTSWQQDWRVFQTRFDWWETNGVVSSDGDILGPWANPDDQPNPHGGNWNRSFNMGFYTKFYSKRIGAYPMYGMARADWNDFSIGNVSPYDKPNGLGDGYGITDKRRWYTTTDENGDGYGHWFNPQFLGGNAWGGSSVFYTELNMMSTFPNGARAMNIMPDIISDGHNDNPGFGEKLATDYNCGTIGHWNESNIIHAAVVSPGLEVSASTLGSSRPYKNASMWHDFHAGNNLWGLDGTVDNKCLGYGANVDQSNSDDDEFGTYSEEWADFTLGNRTIVLSLGNHSMLPITRHCLQDNNARENVRWVFGGSIYQMPYGTEINGTYLNTDYWGRAENYHAYEVSREQGGSRWSKYSPEVTMASITKKQNLETMYGGSSMNSFRKNTFITTGHFRAVNQDGSFKAVGNSGDHVFGGDTYICNFNLKKNHDDDTNRIVSNPNGGEKNHSEAGVCLAYTCPVETETNLDLRHGFFFGSNTDIIPKEIPDDFGSAAYNNSYDADNILQAFSLKPTDWIDADGWPATVAFSEAKFAGDFTDSFSIFPPNQIRDLDHSKGAITQMFKLQNNLFALQESGTCQLTVNPRVMIPAGEGGAITTITGTSSVIERFDYVSENYGSQHFHGRAITDRAAYYYDDTNSKFLKLGRGKGGGWNVTSLGDTLGMQQYFQRFSNHTINDKPLCALDYASVDAVGALGDMGNGDYMFLRQTFHNTMVHDALTTIYGKYGGISMGYDREFGEVLFTIFPEKLMPSTIVYNENLDVFTSFVSKRPAQYIEHAGRLYTTYDDYSIGASNRVYLANGYSDVRPVSMPGSGQPTSFWNSDINEAQSLERVEFKYLTFGGIDYYQFGHKLDTNDDVEGNQSNYDVFTTGMGDEFANSEDQYSYWYPTYVPGGEYGGDYLEPYGLAQAHLMYKEPVQVQFIINDEPNMTKVFDNIDISITGDTNVGKNYLYFRKFAFYGSANVHAIHEFDMSEFQIFENISTTDGEGVYQKYSGANIGFRNDPEKRMWYNVKEGTHHIPLRATGYGQPIPTQVGAKEIEKTCRGNYAHVAMVMGWDENNKFFGETVNQFKTQSGAPTTGNLKDEGFSILSLVPYYRYSRR